MEGENTIEQVVLLVGGFGTRLGELTKNTPKPLLPIAGRPFLDYLLDNIARQGVKRILLLAGYCGEMVHELYHGKNILGQTELEVLVEPKPLGTGGGIVTFSECFDEHFILMNGDSFFDINLNLLARTLLECDVNVVMATRFVSDTRRYGRVLIDGQSRIRDFREKNVNPGEEGEINGGIYAINKRCLARFPEDVTLSFETDILYQLVLDGQVLANRQDRYFLDIGIPDSYARGQLEIPSLVCRPALFITIKSIINGNPVYTDKNEAILFKNGAVRTIKFFNERGWFVISLLAQDDISKGIHSEESLNFFRQTVQAELRKQGAHVDALYNLSCYPQLIKGTAKVSLSRDNIEPDILNQTSNDWTIISDKSVAICDKISKLNTSYLKKIPVYELNKGNLFDFCEANNLFPKQVHGSLPN